MMAALSGGYETQTQQTDLLKAPQGRRGGKSHFLSLSFLVSLVHTPLFLFAPLGPITVQIYEYCISTFSNVCSRM